MEVVLAGRDVLRDRALPPGAFGASGRGEEPDDLVRQRPGRRILGEARADQRLEQGWYAIQARGAVDDLVLHGGDV
ncbi:hypothetical protein [Streptomyces violascens]|uniref:hypothetical protein n=1 Tax=Streptomyces violascens TaxID=67381 RepID=UPI0036892709